MIFFYFNIPIDVYSTPQTEVVYYLALFTKSRLAFSFQVIPVFWDHF